MIYLILSFDIFRHKPGGTRYPSERSELATLASGASLLEKARLREIVLGSRRRARGYDMWLCSG